MTSSYADELRARFGFDVDLGEGDLPDHPWLHQVIARRTQRRYTDKPVPEALVRLLLATAFSTSAKSDFQQASVLWLRDQAARNEIAAFYPDMPWIGASPVFLVFLGDARRLDRIGELRGHKHDNGSMEGFFNAAVDAALAIQSCILAAETVGLGTCPISVLRNRVKEVGEILGLPDKVFPVAGLCLGYPSQSGFVSMRLGPDATVHVDKYDDSGLAEAVDGYDRRRDARFSIGDKQRDTKRFGVAEFYGWSEDKARQAAAAEGKGFATWLKAHGFTFEEPG